MSSTRPTLVAAEGAIHLAGRPTAVVPRLQLDPEGGVVGTRSGSGPPLMSRPASAPANAPIADPARDPMEAGANATPHADPVDEQGCGPASWFLMCEGDNWDFRVVALVGWPAMPTWDRSGWENAMVQAESCLSPGVNQVDPDPSEIDPVAGCQLDAPGQGGGRDVGISRGDRTAQEFPLPQHLSIPMSGLPAEGPDPFIVVMPSLAGSK